MSDSLRVRLQATRWLGCVAALAMALAAVGIGVGAQSAHAQSAEVKAQARDAFNQGVAAYQSGSYESALKSFQKAYDLLPHPVTRLNIANTYQRMSQPAEALYHFEHYLQEAGPTLAPAKRKEVEDSIASLSRMVGKVNLSVQPGQARVIVDRRQEYALPLAEPMPLIIGKHHLQFMRDGYHVEERTVELKAGEVRRVDVTLRPQSRAVAAAPAVTPKPTRSAAEPPKEQIIDAFDDAPPAAATSTEPVAAEAAEATPDEQPSRSIFTTPVVVAGAATIAAATAAVITGVLALKADSDFDDHSSSAKSASLPASERESARKQALDDADRADQLAVVTNVLLGAAVIGAGATVYLAVSGAGAERAPSGSAKKRTPQRGFAAAIAPAIAPSGAALNLRGSF